MNLHKLRHRITLTALRHPLNTIQHLGLKANDTIIAAYPKSGTTWLRFLLFNLLFDLDATFADVNRRIPDLGRHFFLKSAPGSRFVKSHEPYRKSYKKAIYMVRDGRDVVLSEYHFQIWSGFISQDYSFDRFLDRFLHEGVNRYGKWSDHVESWMNAKEEAAVDAHVLKYEDLKKDAINEMNSVLRFMQLDASASEVRAAVESNTADRMRRKEQAERDSLFAHTMSGRSFVRTARAGGWRSSLSPGQVARFEEHAGGALERLGYL